MIDNLKPADKEVVVKAEAAVTKKMQDIQAGQTAPTGFFDPLGFSTDIDEDTLIFYREAELKHGRIGMLATLGMVVGEQYHPLFGGMIDGPAEKMAHATDLPGFWGGLFICLSVPEVALLLLPKGPYGIGGQGIPGEVGDTERIPGDLGFDPLNLKPIDPAALVEIQTKEINNGRLAMLAAAGIIAQETVTGEKIFR